MYTDLRVRHIGEFSGHYEEFSGKFLLHFFLRQRDNASVMLQYSSARTILTKMMCQFELLFEKLLLVG